MRIATELPGIQAELPDGQLLELPVSGRAHSGRAKFREVYSEGGELAPKPVALIIAGQRFAIP